MVENLPPTAEFEPVTKGAKRTDKRDAPPAGDGQQWVWEIAKLMPGERKVFEYRVTAREAKDVYALTSLAAAKGLTDRAEARTQVLVPGLTVKLTGPSPSAPWNAAQAISRSSARTVASPVSTVSGRSATRITRPANTSSSTRCRCRSSARRC